jgi:GT2 family glycosyltransferase
LRNETGYTNFNVIVVDNGSVDDTVRLIEEKFPWVDIVVLGKNYGFSIGSNKGIAYALKKFDPEYVLLLNNDTEIVQGNWLRRLVAIAESEEAIGVVGCRLVHTDGRSQYIGTKLTVTGLSWLKPRDHANLPEIYTVDTVLGACFLVKRRVIDRIGGLDPEFSPFSDEESDFCMRAKKAGFRICMVSTVKVVHRHGASINRVDPEFVRLTVRRNAIRFMLLNFPASWLVKRVPYEARIFIRCFFARNQGVKQGLPITLRDSGDMLMEVKANAKGWWYNLRNLHEIIVKRRNRTMKLPLTA